MATDPLNDAMEDVLIRSLSDIIQIAELADVVQDSLGIPFSGATDAEDADDPRVIDGSAEVIRRLLDGSLMILGDLVFGPETPAYVEPWPLSPTGAAERVRREWLALGRRINLADIGWLERTPAGEERGRAALNARR